MTITVDRLGPSQFSEVLDQVAALRIEVFRSFPYLYDGNVEYEEKYLATYLQSSDAVWVIARAAGTIVGVSTGLPLSDEDDAFHSPFIARGIEPAAVFYFGESVLKADYRGLGIGHRFFDEREAHARALGRFRHLAFAAVDRADDDPRRPHDHRDLDPFWIRRGYRRQSDMKFPMAWRELGETEESDKTLTYWIRTLDR